MTWQPINTAPRDGTWFRARTREGTERIVRFADYADRFPIHDDMDPWPTAPAEWAWVGGKAK